MSGTRDAVNAALADARLLGFTIWAPGEYVQDYHPGGKRLPAALGNVFQGNVELVRTILEADPDYFPERRPPAESHCPEQSAVASEPAPEDATIGPTGPVITIMSSVRAEQVSWLWPGYIALGKLTVLDGDPGLGKSSMLLDVAARVSTGRELPDGSCGDIRGPAGTVLLSAEDGLADTVRPRLDAAGADTTRIAALEATRVVNLTTGETEEEGITLADLTAIEEAVSAVRAKLVIIDPLMAYLSAETNSYRDQDVRRVLTPLTRLAERLGVAVVIVRHFSKTVGGSAVYRGSGSIGIIGAARLGLMVAADPDDPDGLRRVLAVTKSNLAKKPPALAYTLQDAENGVARIEWLGSTGHTASSLVAVPDQGADDHGALAEAKDVLQQILRDGRVKASDVKTQAKEAGISEITLKRAKKALGVKAVRDGFGSAGVWYWHLPVNWEQSKGIIQSEGDHLFGDDPLWDSVIPFDSYQREVAGGIEDGEVAD